MLVDPLVLKKKLNRMATEQGAFAVLSSLLLYVTKLAAGDPQLSSKRTKWAEGKENKVSYNQPCPGPNRGQHPTRFQLLRSRFLNNNREPYTKKRREVGKLVIKEKLWVSRAGNRDRKGEGKATEEDADTVPSERARWSSASGKNTVKNILKKFLAAEEKEAKEKSPSWKKKGPNSGLPKIVNKSSVLSKLKEQFEQSALCSAAEVKASLLRKGEKKTKNFLSRKTIRKPEVRVLRTAAMTATGINSPESQYLVCSTVPVPKLSIATKINHPWSWSKNNAAMQPFGHDTPVKEKAGSDRDPGEKKTPANATRDREDQEELLVAPKAVPDAKDHAEAKIDSTKQGPNFNPNLYSSSTTCKNKALADCFPPSSEHSLGSDRNNMPYGPDTSSLSGVTDAVQHIKEDIPPSNSLSSSTAEGSHEQSLQDTKMGEIPEITMYVYSSEEADTELTEPEKDPFFAGQKCFPEQKAMENILPFHSPRVQAFCEVEPPTEDRQLSVLTPASSKKPPIVQKEAPGLRGRCSEEAKGGVNYHSEDKISSTSSKNDNNVPTIKEEENKTPNSQMQNESKTKHPQPPQMPSPQNNFGNSSPDISNPDVNQTKPTLSSNENQDRNPGAAEEHTSSHLERTQSPLPGDLVKHSFYFADEDFGKEKLSSSNEMMNHALGKSTLTDLETCHSQSKSFIEREEATADEMPWPDSEACQSPSSNPLPTPMNGIAGQRIHHTLGNPPALPPIDLVRQGAGGVEDEHASHGCGKYPLPSSDKLTNCGNDTMVEKKTEKIACDFKNQVSSPIHTTENENSTAEETNTCQSTENYLSLSTKKPGKHENKTTLARKPLLLVEKNRTPTSDDTIKQGNDMLEENLFPSSTELVANQKKHPNGSDKFSRHKKDKFLSSDDDMKHENDKTDTEEREERNALHKSEEEYISTPSDTMDHDNNSSNEENAHRPQTSQFPSPDTNIQGMKNTEESLKRLTASRDFVKHEHDLTVDENICSNRKHNLSLSNEPMKRANGSAEERNIKSNFKNYSMTTRNTSSQENKTTDEEKFPPNLKKELVQHKKVGEGERNTSCDPKNQIPSLNPLVKQDNKSSPLETQKQMSPGDFVKPETKSAEKKTKHTSGKLQSPSDKVQKPQERSSSGERKQKTPAVEDTGSPETKAVKEDNEHQHSGKYQLPPSTKSAKREENTPGGVKQQTRCEDFTMIDTNAAKKKNKFPSSRKYRSISSETLVIPQEINTTEQKQQTPPSASLKKPGTNAVKEKEEGPNSEKSPSSKKVVESQEKNISGNRKQKTPAAEDIRSTEAKAVKEDNEHQHSGKYQLPPSTKSAKSEENTPGGVKQQTRYEDFTMIDTNAAKKKNKFPSSRKYRSISSETLVTPQEINTTEQKQQTPPSASFKKPGTNAVKEKEEGPNSEKSPSSKKVVESQEKNISGDRKQKTPAAEDIRSTEAKAVKEDDENQCSGNHQLPPSSNSSKPEKNTPGGEKQKAVSGSFTKPDASAVKDKSKDPGSGMCQSPSSNLLVKPQEKNTTAKKKQSPPPPDEKTMYKTGSAEKRSRPERREKYQLLSSAQSEKHSSDGSGEEGLVSNFKSYQTPLPSDGINCKSNTIPKETSLSNTEKPPKSSSFLVASKDEENPAGNRKRQPGFKKYQALSSKNLVRHEKDVTEREGSWQAAGKTNERKAELEDCSKAPSFSKYTVESYSEGPLDSSFKPLIIRVSDTFKHHS